MYRSRLLQRARAGGGGRACSHDIVYQQDALSAKGAIPLNGEGSGDVEAALGIAQTGLRRGSAYAAHHRRNWHTGTLRHNLGKQGGLVEAALPTPSPMQGQGNNQIETLLTRQRGTEKSSQRFCERSNAAVLKNMDQLAQNAFISTEGVSGVISAEPGAAQTATALFIQWKRI